MDKHLQRYARHRPEQTTLYRLVQQHAASFIAHIEASTGSELPGFIKAELRAVSASHGQHQGQP